MTKAKSNVMTDFVAPISVLVIICVVMSGLLALTNGATEPIIKAAELEAQKAVIAFDIYEYDADEDQLTHERCKAAIAGGEAMLSQTTYEDEEVTSKRLCDLGFADESEMDDEELAVMLSAEHPDGPEADDLVDAIEDVRNDERHQGVFTQQETSDPVAFSQMIEAATADEIGRASCRERVF